VSTEFTNPSFPRDVPLGTLLGGRYRLVEVLASGGAGTVFRAVQDNLGRDVALKVLRNDIDAASRAEFESRFLREGALAGRLSSPYVVTVHDFGTDLTTGTRYVVMELLHGVSLSERLREGTIPPAQAARLGEGIARGLRHAHGQGIIHRDIKPGNILLVADDDAVEIPKIVDFGLVKDLDVMEAELTTTGMYLGTPTYMAPEQARGQGGVTGRADVYSLGCVMYRMLAGRAPFRADSAIATALMHLQAKPDPLKPYGVDPQLEAIVMRCLAKDPVDRPNADELVELLRAYRGGAPVGGGDEHSTFNRGLHLPGLQRPWWQRAAVRSALYAGTVVLLLGAVMLACGASLLLLMWPQAPAPSVHRPSLVEGIDVTPFVDEPSADEPRRHVAPEPPEPATPSAAPPAPAHVAAPPPVAPPEAPVAPTPSAEAAPPPIPAPAAAPPATVAAAVRVDGVAFDAAHAARALTFVNTASEEQLRAAGVYGRGVSVVLGGRPFASLSAFGDTPYVGAKTVEAVHAATAAP